MIMKKILLIAAMMAVVMPGMAQQYNSHILHQLYIPEPLWDSTPLEPHG